MNSENIHLGRKGFDQFKLFFKFGWPKKLVGNYCMAQENGLQHANIVGNLTTVTTYLMILKFFSHIFLENFNLEVLIQHLLFFFQP